MLYIKYLVLCVIFYNKLYGFPQKFLTCMLNLPMQPVILLCRFTAGLQIRALVAVILYSVFQPFYLFSSSDYLHSYPLPPLTIISQKTQFITFILRNSFFYCIISTIYGYNQSYISYYNIYNYYIP